MTNTKCTDFQVRQGDVYLFLLKDKLPIDLITVKPVGNNYILAYGESSGHAHAIRRDNCELYYANDNLIELAKKYGIFEPRAVTHALRIVSDNARLLHGTPTKDFTDPSDADHEPISLPIGDYIVLRPREYSDEEEFKVIAD